MVGADHSGYATRVCQLTWITSILIVVAYRERAYGFGVFLRKQHRVDARINATGEKYTHWDITDFSQFHCTAQFCAYAIDDLLLAVFAQRLCVIPNIPITPLF